MRGMKIGILQTDDVRDALQAQHGHYPDMFKGLLRGFGFEFATFDVRQNQYPSEPKACQGYIVTGSRHSTYDPQVAWIPALKDFIRNNFEQAGVPLLGVCFGHQVVADALGGQNVKSQKGWGLGLHEWQVVRRAAWMRGDSDSDSDSPPRDSLSLYVSHQDQVETLPQGAEVLLASEFCANAAYAIDERIFCLQGHPEFTSEFSKALIHLREEANDISHEVSEERLRSCDTPADTARCASWIARFFKKA